MVPHCQATKVHRPFKEATKEVSAEQYVTISKVIPLVSLLQHATSSAGQRNNTLASQLAAQCEQRFQNIEHNHILAVSTFLDIRFKNIVFCDPGNVETIKSRIITEMQALACSERRATSHEASATASTDCMRTALSVTQGPPAANTERSNTQCSMSKGLW